MTTRNIATTTRRIVLALGVATAALVAIPSTQAAHAAGAKPNPVAPSGWHIHSVTPSAGWRGVTPSGTWEGHTSQGFQWGKSPQGFQWGKSPVSFRFDVKPQGWGH